MIEPNARLYLVTPLIENPDAFAPQLAQACGAGAVAAVLLRLGAGEERSLINRVKVLAPVAQEHGAAVLVSSEGDADIATLVARGGADGGHVRCDAKALTTLRDRLKDRSLGVGGLRSKHDAMTVAETGADYLMFGEPRADGSLPSVEFTIERAAWWAEIFQIPCVVHAPTIDDVPALARTGAEFLALGDPVWRHPEGPAAGVRAAIDAIGTREMAS